MIKKQLKPLTFEELRVKNLQRCEEVFHPLHSWDECAWFTALSGELGNYIKKRRREQADWNGRNGDKELFNLHREDIKKEIGDIACYLDLIATKFGFRLEDCTRDKFNIVSLRKKSKIKL
ncbi:MAG: hypothetical protein AABY22_20940 [Nanoarchaeota archaeon]